MRPVMLSIDFGLFFGTAMLQNVSRNVKESFALSLPMIMMMTNEIEIECVSVLNILHQIKSSFSLPLFSILQRIIFYCVALKLLRSTQEYVLDDQDMLRRSTSFVDILDKQCIVVSSLGFKLIANNQKNSQLQSLYFLNINLLAVSFGSSGLTAKVLKTFVKRIPQPHDEQIEGLLKPFPADNRSLPRVLKVVGLGQSPPLLSFVKTRTEVFFLLRNVKNFVANTKLNPHSQFTKILSFIFLNFPNEIVQNRTFQHIFSQIWLMSTE
jgi:hypothetical protein